MIINIIANNKQIFTMDVERDIDNALKFSELLNKYGLRGEFYISGNLVENFPEKCKIIAENNIVGGHGYKHENFAKLKPILQKELIEKTKKCFSEINIDLKEWRFPWLGFTYSSLQILANMGISDSSFRLSYLKLWKRSFFLANWLKNLLLDHVVYFPKPFPRNLDEKPFLVVDIETTDFYRYNDRIITHCYNYPNFEKDIKSYLKNELRSQISNQK